MKKVKHLVNTLCLAGEPSPPTVHGQREVGKAYRLGLVKQDDGGMPIVEYIVKYKTVSNILPVSTFQDTEILCIVHVIVAAMKMQLESIFFISVADLSL